MKIRAAVQAARDSGILILARTDCRPTQGLEEALARIAIFAEEGADILFLDSPENPDEIRQAVAAAGGRPSFCVLALAPPRQVPTRAEAEALGLKIGTYPQGMISPVAAAIQAGLAAAAAGEAVTPGALPTAELRALLGFAEYDEQARPFIVQG